MALSPTWRIPRVLTTPKKALGPSNPTCDHRGLYPDRRLSARPALRPLAFPRGPGPRQAQPGTTGLTRALLRLSLALTHTILRSSLLFSGCFTTRPGRNITAVESWSCRGPPFELFAFSPRRHADVAFRFPSSPDQPGQFGGAQGSLPGARPLASHTSLIAGATKLLIGRRHMIANVSPARAGSRLPLVASA